MGWLYEKLDFGQQQPIKIQKFGYHGNIYLTTPKQNSYKPFSMLKLYNVIQLFAVKLLILCFDIGISLQTLYL